MNVSINWIRQQIAICLVFFMAAPFVEAGTAMPQQTPAGQQTESTSSAQTQPQNADSSTNKPAGTEGQIEALPAAPDSGRPQTGPTQQQNSTSEPVGTAVAPYEKPVGVAASSPAGAAIAPAKQKRSRSILISVGVIAAAAVAVGTVVALSDGSPSRPH